MKTKNFFCLDINFFKVFREILSATEERTLNGFLKSPFSYAYFISIVFPEQFQINFLPRNIWIQYFFNEVSNTTMQH